MAKEEKTLSEQDKQRIEQEAINRNFHGIAVKIFTEGGEYEHKYQREQRDEEGERWAELHRNDGFEIDELLEQLKQLKEQKAVLKEGLDKAIKACSQLEQLKEENERLKEVISEQQDLLKEFGEADQTCFTLIKDAKAEVIKFKAEIEELKEQNKKLHERTIKESHCR